MAPDSIWSRMVWTFTCAPLNVDLSAYGNLTGVGGRKLVKVGPFWKTPPYPTPD